MTSEVDECHKNALKVAEIATICPKNGIVYEINRSIEYKQDQPINNHSQLKLMIVTPELNEIIERKQQQLYIYKDRDKNCYMCSSDSTYQLDTVSTSNTIYLVSNLDTTLSTTTDNLISCDVIKNFASVIQAKKIMPNPLLLRAILRQNPLRIDNNNVAVGVVKVGPFFSEKDLLEKSHMSQMELHQSLELVNAFHHQPTNTWTLLDINSTADILIEILQAIIRMNYDPSCCPINELYEFLFKYDRSYLDYVLLKLHSDSSVENDTNHVAVDEFKAYQVSRTLFEYLLCKSSHCMLLDELVGIVEKCCPKNFKVRIDALKRMATITKTIEGSLVSYFPVELLSDEPSKRIIEMFKFQNCWEENQLYDYMQDFNDHDKFIKRYTLFTSSKNKNVYQLKPGIML